MTISHALSVILPLLPPVVRPPSDLSLLRPFFPGSMRPTPAKFPPSVILSPPFFIEYLYALQRQFSPILLFLQRFWNPHQPSLGQPIAIQCLQASWLVGVTSFCCPEFIISILCSPLPAHRPNGWPGDISPPFTHNGCKLNSFPLIVFLIVLTSWARAAGLWRCHCFLTTSFGHPSPLLTRIHFPLIVFLIVLAN